MAMIGCRDEYKPLFDACKTDEQLFKLVGDLLNEIDDVKFAVYLTGINFAGCRYAEASVSHRDPQKDLMQMFVVEDEDVPKIYDAFLITDELQVSGPRITLGRVYVAPRPKDLAKYEKNMTSVDLPLPQFTIKCPRCGSHKGAMVLDGGSDLCPQCNIAYHFCLGEQKVVESGETGGPKFCPRCCSKAAELKEAFH